MNEKLKKALHVKGIVFSPLQGQQNVLHCRANNGHGSLFYLYVEGVTLYRTIEVPTISGGTRIKRWGDDVFLSLV